jgi:cyclopropane-fatty-acyl-phospholipid synthase
MPDSSAMARNRAERLVRELVGLADIEVGGSRPWDIAVHDDRFYGRILRHGALGLGESYMDGWWDVDRLDEFVCRLRRARIDEKVRRDLRTLSLLLGERLSNRQRRSKSPVVGRRHYDLGNDLFQAMLDRRMVYSCAIWDDAKSLDEAQERKLELTCRKLHVEPGMTLLDIGCGWGGLAKYAADNWGVAVVGINNSREQIALGRQMCAGSQVELQFRDYRDVEGTFDRVVSIGMFEHVGVKNYAAYMDVANRCLRDDGLFLLHTIGGNAPSRHLDTWTEKYIFPRGVLPSASQVAAASEGLFVMEDWHNLSVNYERTLLAWHENFTRGWGELSAAYGDRFYRMWSFYLLSCAGSFRARSLQVWQIVFSKGGVKGGYRPSRWEVTGA